MVVSRGWEENLEELVFNGHRVSVWEDEKVLEMDRVVDGQTTRLHLMQLNWLRWG
jgi:hypothetical protein